MKKKVKVTQEYINQLKIDRDRLRKERDEIQADLNKHRDYWSWLFREVVIIHGKGNSVASPWLIESMAKQFNKVKSWYWG